MRVFRVENDRGIGMYGACTNLHHAPGYKTEFDRHPSPLDEGPSFRKAWDALTWGQREQFSFGFDSVHQCLRWLYMNRWRKFLEENGFKLNEYEVAMEYLIKGDCQVVFRKDAAELVGTHSLASFDD